MSVMTIKRHIFNPFYVLHPYNNKSRIRVASYV